MWTTTVCSGHTTRSKYSKCGIPARKQSFGSSQRSWPAMTPCPSLHLGSGFGGGGGGGHVAFPLHGFGGGGGIGHLPLTGIDPSLHGIGIHFPLLSTSVPLGHGGCGGAGGHLPLLSGCAPLGHVGGGVGGGFGGGVEGGGGELPEPDEGVRGLPPLILPLPPFGLLLLEPCEELPVSAELELESELLFW